MHTLSLSADYQATNKLKLNASVVYNKADDSWDWDFSERDKMYTEAGAYSGAGTIPLAQNGLETPGPYASVNYDTWEMNNNVDSYSDLSYEQYSFTLGGTYNFTDALYTSIEGTYDLFYSDEKYVYGDEDGKAFSGYVAIGYKF